MTYLNANVSPEVYYLYQEWTHRFGKIKKHSDRNYSFLGLYRKYSEADVYELLELAKKREKVERKVDIVTLFASFFGNSIFTIFFTNI